MKNNRIRLTESQLHNIIRKCVNEAVNEVSLDDKLRGVAGTSAQIEKLRGMQKNGQRTFERNGMTLDVDNELDRKIKQRDNFSKSASSEIDVNYQKEVNAARERLEMAKQNLEQIKSNKNIGDEYDKEITLQKAKRRVEWAQSYLHNLLTNYNGGYSIDSFNGGGFQINTPTGSAYSNYNNRGVQYTSTNANRGNLKNLDNYQDMTDSMMGMYDEISGDSQRRTASMKRIRDNVQKINDYDRESAIWDDENAKIKQQQGQYDSMSWMNPKKWTRKRPNDISRPRPVAPEWEKNENGEYDGYFASSNPNDYDDAISDFNNRQNLYRNARNNRWK